MLKKCVSLLFAMLAPIGAAGQDIEPLTPRSSDDAYIRGLQDFLVSIDTGDPLVDAQLRVICSSRLPELTPIQNDAVSEPTPSRQLEQSVTSALALVYSVSGSSTTAAVQVAGVLERHGCDPQLVTQVPFENWSGDSAARASDPVLRAYLGQRVIARDTALSSPFDYADAGPQCASALSEMDLLCSGAINVYDAFVAYGAAADPERSSRGLGTALVLELAGELGKATGKWIDDWLRESESPTSEDGQTITTDDDLRDYWAGDKQPAGTEGDPFNMVTPEEEAARNEAEVKRALDLVPSQGGPTQQQQPPPQDPNTDTAAFMEFVANVWGPRVSRAVSEYRSCTEPPDYRHFNSTPQAERQIAPACDVEAVKRDLTPQPADPNAPPPSDFRDEERERREKTIGFSCPLDIETAEYCEQIADEYYRHAGYDGGVTEYCVLYPMAQPCELSRRVEWLDDPVAQEFQFPVEQDAGPRAQEFDWLGSDSLNIRIRECFLDGSCAQTMR